MSICGEDDGPYRAYGTYRAYVAEARECDGAMGTGIETDVGELFGERGCAGDGNLGTGTLTVTGEVAGGGPLGSPPGEGDGAGGTGIEAEIGVAADGGA